MKEQKTQAAPGQDKGQSAKLKIIVAIPCYNEEGFITDVVHKALKYVDEVVVVDDGSSDGTVEVAKAAGAVVRSHAVNSGYGQAIRSCFEAARSANADIMVIMDGDGQHNPDELPQILEPILRGATDIVIGSRFMDGKDEVPRFRKFGIDVITFLLNVGVKPKFKDSQCGFRAFNKKSIETLILKEKGMGISVEMLVKARRKGLVMLEVPTSCKYHPHSSTLNPVTHGLGVAMSVVRNRLSRDV